MRGASFGDEDGEVGVLREAMVSAETRQPKELITPSTISGALFSGGDGCASPVKSREPPEGHGAVDYAQSPATMTASPQYLPCPSPVKRLEINLSIHTNKDEGGGIRIQTTFKKNRESRQLRFQVTTTVKNKIEGTAKPPQVR
jgi:hypothetical protein